MKKTTVGSARKRRRSGTPTEFDRMLGRNLREFRQQRGQTLKELAEKLGFSLQQLQKYETGSNKLSVNMLPVVAEALGVELTQLFDDPDTPNSKSPEQQLREDCIAWLRRTKSIERLQMMSRVLKAMSTQ